MTALATAPVETARASVRDYAGTWIVACCEPESERLLIRELTEQAGIPSFWPRIQVVRISTDKKGWRHRNREARSLFPGYISFCCEHHQHNRVAGHDRVNTILWERNQDKFIREISIVEAGIAADPEFTTYPVSTIGQRCRIKKPHPFRTQEGEIIDTKGGKRFVVLVETFGQKVPMEIDFDLLEPV